VRHIAGYRHFAAQGGDWGGFVCSRLGYAHADKLLGIHLNLLAVRRDPKMLAEQKQHLRKWENNVRYWKLRTSYLCPVVK
jgi:hypothetical protein